MIVKGERFESTNIPLENEDNCVLNKDEMELTGKCIKAAIQMVETRNASANLNRFKHDCTQLFQKITRLNDMAKEKQK